MTGGTVPPAFRFLTAVVDPIAQSRAFMIFICRYLSTAASVRPWSSVPVGQRRIRRFGGSEGKRDVHWFHANIIIVIYGRPHSKHLNSSCILVPICPNSTWTPHPNGAWLTFWHVVPSLFGPLYGTPPEADGKKPKQLPGRVPWHGDILHHPESYYFKHLQTSLVS